MGLYFPAPPTFLGAAQPLTPKELTPPSGPAPSNPVFGAVSLAAALVSAWAAVAAPLPQQRPPVAAIAAAAAQLPPPPPPQPYAWAQADWPQPPRRFITLSGPAPNNPPVRVQTVPAEVLVGWLPPPPRAPVAVNLDPPIAGPAPQAPPIAGGAQVPQAVLVAWLPPPSQPPQAVNLDPPIAGPVPQAPPLQAPRTLVEILAAWAPVGAPPQQSPGLVPAAPAAQPLPSPQRQAYAWPAPGSLGDWPQPQRQFVTLSGPAPGNPPVRVQTVPAEVLIGWLPPPPQAPVAVNLDPPVAGPAPQAPPIAGGAQVPQAVLVAWLPPPPQAPAAVNLDPPIAGPPPQAPPSWVRTPTEFAAWAASPAPLPQQRPGLIPAAPAAQPLPSPQRQAYAWPAPGSLGDWPQPQRRFVTLSGPAPGNPPVRVQTVPAEVLVAWLPPPPQAPVAVNLDPPISGTTPVTGGGGLLYEWAAGPTAGPGPVILARADRPLFARAGQVLRARANTILPAPADLAPKKG